MDLGLLNISDTGLRQATDDRSSSRPLVIRTTNLFVSVMIIYFNVKQLIFLLLQMNYAIIGEKQKIILAEKSKEFAKMFSDLTLIKLAGL